MHGILLFITGLLMSLAERRGKYSMSSVIQQFKIFFSIIFPTWILLAVTGHIAGRLGRIYTVLVVLAFIVLAIMLLQHVIMERSLLDEYNKYEDRRDDEDDQ